jgi:hypothetical protein
MKQIPAAFIALSLLTSIISPLTAHADIEAPPPKQPPTFEKAAKLSLAIKIDGVSVTDLGTTTLAAGAHEVSYDFGYEDAWFSDPALDAAARERIFAETLRDYRSYLTLWRGAPLTTEAERIASWDISESKTGTVSVALPGPGTYFFLADIPNYVYRDPIAQCTRVEDPLEYCQPDFTLGMAVEASWDFVHSPWASIEMADGGVYHPQGFGGVRFTNENVVAPTGTSNVLFLPGLQGSRLYENVLGFEKRRWELGIGSSQLDARALYSDTSGASLKSIYTKDDGVIATVDVPFAKFDLYRSFLDQLEGFRQEGKITDYAAFPYDWRANPTDVVEQGVPYAEGRHDIVHEVERLAGSSKTGKVTIAGHSNGGLVAKALMRRLEREGKAALIDQVIFIDTPQLGTPQAIAPMLHGDYGSLTSFGGLYLTKENARGLAENMPDAYALLPSDAYFNHVPGTLIDLSLAPNLRSVANLPNGVSTPEEFETFLTSRAKPPAGDIETPNTLSSSQLSRAKTMHAELDAWTAPASVRAIAISGFGLDTAKGITYVEKKEKDCLLLVIVCKDVTKLTHRADMTTAGDGTVIAASEASGNTETYMLDIAGANNANQTNWRHGTVTESKPLQQLFAKLLEGDTAELPTFVSQTVPEATTARTRIRVLSPVTLDAYDDQGRHTGPAKNPDATSDLLYKEEQIPNSYYEEFGEGKYLGLPADANVTIRLQGTDTGTFTYEVTKVDRSGNETVMTYEDVPVTSSTTASMALTPSGAIQLDIDSDSDGSMDANLAGGESMNPLTYMGIMRQLFGSMQLATSTEAQLSAKLINLDHILRKQQAWDDRDDDADRNDSKKGERAEVRALRKIDKLDAWTLRLLAKNAKNGTQVKIVLEPKNAQALLAMTTRLRELIR